VAERSHDEKPGATLDCLVLQDFTNWRTIRFDLDKFGCDRMPRKMSEQS
jgi:hypothetical protein